MNPIRTLKRVVSILLYIFACVLILIAFLIFEYCFSKDCNPLEGVFTRAKNYPDKE